MCDSLWERPRELATWRVTVLRLTRTRTATPSGFSCSPVSGSPSG